MTAYLWTLAARWRDRDLRALDRRRRALAGIGSTVERVRAAR